MAPLPPPEDPLQVAIKEDAPAPARGHDVIALGASAGGLKVVGQILEALPQDLPAAIFVVIHLSPHFPSHMSSILGRVSRLPVHSPADGEPLRKGHVYVAPRDRHLLVERDRIRVVHGPRENRHRPAIDPLFRSAAWAHGPHVAAAVLTGWLDDGVAGLWAVKSMGGATIVQAPEEADAPGMPEAALRGVDVDYVRSAAEIASLLVDLVLDPVTASTFRPGSEKLAVEVGFSRLDPEVKDMDVFGKPSAFTCPSCRGALWEFVDGEALRFRCHVGHAFSAQSLLQEQEVELEGALYSAIHALEEKASTSRRIGQHLARSLPKVEARYEATAIELEASAAVLRRLLAGGKP